MFMAYACHSIPAYIANGSLQKERGLVTGRVVVHKIAVRWKNFKTAMKEKRIGKRKAPSHDILQKKEIVIQRLSTEVTGKAQKYSRIGPRKFVPYEYDEMTLNNIKDACTRHLALAVRERMTCDVLASEQGPSCSSLEQIPDLKVVHIRFIEPNNRDVASMAGNRVKRDEQPKQPFRRASNNPNRYQLGKQAQVKPFQRVCRCWK